MNTATAPKITMQPVESSNLAAAGYDPATQTLAIRFKGGVLYHYHDVTPADYEAFTKAKSKGGHFHTAIRGKFKFTKIGG